MWPRLVAGVRAGLGDIPHTVLADAALVPDAVGPPTLDALAEQITTEPFTMLHLVCHGNVSRDGRDRHLSGRCRRTGWTPVSASQLIERLRRLQGVRRPAPLRLPLHLRERRARSRGGSWADWANAWCETWACPPWWP